MKTLAIPFAYTAYVTHGAHRVDRTFVEDYRATAPTVTGAEAPVVVQTGRSIRRGPSLDDRIPNDIRLYNGELYETVRTEYYDTALLRHALTPTLEDMPDDKILHGIFATISPGHPARSVGTTKLKGPPSPSRVVISHRDEVLKDMQALERDLLVVDGVFHVRIRSLALVAGPNGVRLGEGDILHENRLNLFWLDETENAKRRAAILTETKAAEGTDVKVEPFTVVDATWLSQIDKTLRDTTQLLAAAYDLEKNVASAQIFPSLPLSAMYAFDDLREYRLSNSRYDKPQPPSPTELRRLIVNLASEVEAAGYSWTSRLPRDVVAASLDREPDDFTLAPALG